MDRQAWQQVCLPTESPHQPQLMVPSVMNRRLRAVYLLEKLHTTETQGVSPCLICVCECAHVCACLWEPETVFLNPSPPQVFQLFRDLLMFETGFLAEAGLTLTLQRRMTLTLLPPPPEC